MRPSTIDDDDRHDQRRIGRRLASDQPSGFGGPTNRSSRPAGGSASWPTELRRPNAQDLLLAATADVGDADLPMLRPLWVEESMHRAHTLLRLFQALRGRQCAMVGLAHHLENCLAREIAGAFRSLEVPSVNEVVACSGVLRGLVRDLIALFGPGVGLVEIRTHIERIALPGYARRALVLLAAELVSNALLHGFAERRHGLVMVDLVARPGGRVRLRVRDDGSGFPAIPCVSACSVSHGLSDLLNGELAYARSACGATVATVEFPIP